MKHLYNGSIYRQDGVYFATNDKDKMINYNNCINSLKRDLCSMFSEKKLIIKFFIKTGYENFSVYKK